VPSYDAMLPEVGRRLHRAEFVFAGHVERHRWTATAGQPPRQRATAPAVKSGSSRIVPIRKEALPASRACDNGFVVVWVRSPPGRLIHAGDCAP
jgi:hypothetical protein